MEKVFKDNLKKITALLLVGTMIIPPNTSVLAQDDLMQEVIEQEDNVRDETTIAEDTLTEEIADVVETDMLGSAAIEDEEAREKECMPASEDFLKKFLTYLSLKYPKIGIDVEFGANGGDSTQDPEDDLHNWYNATKMKRQKVYDEIIIDGDDKYASYPDLTKNMVQFRYLGNFGVSIGFDEKGNPIYADTVKTLIIRNVDEIRNLYVPASVENLIIENTTLNCYYCENDSPGFQAGILPGDLKYCENLKKLVLNNVKFGDNYKNPEPALPELESCPYETNYVLNLQNCHNLEELKIDVSFEGVQEIQLAIDGGTENLFSKLKDDKCSINPAPESGSGQVILYANENSYLAKRYNSSETVKFKNGQFRIWLLEALGIDTNHDGVISRAEMDAIETLTINDQTAHSARQSSLSCFQELADIGQMHGLKTLELDFYDPSYSNNANRQPLKGIDFPNSLENLTMKNIYWEKDTQTKSHDNADIVLENLRTLELYNTDVKLGSDDSYFDHSTQIKLTDTEGVLQSCIIERTDVESIELINNSNGKNIKADDEKQRIRFSAGECPKLESIEFGGEGYAVEGSLELTNDMELKHIGVPNNDKSQWIVYGEFDTTDAPVDVILNSCAKLGSDCKEIVIDYDFVNSEKLNVQTMNTAFGVNNKLTIKRQPRKADNKAGNVYLSCDKDKWIYNEYNGKAGFVIEERSSFPTIAVFAAGQNIRTRGEGEHDNDSIYTEDSDRWVERRNIVLSQGGYSNNFGNLRFYVVDKEDDETGKTVENLRRVFYGGKDEPVYVEWKQQNDEDTIITLPTEKVGNEYKLNGTKLSSTGTPGEVELRLYVYKTEGGNRIKSYIGYQNIKIFKMPNSVEIVNNGTKRGLGTKDDPYIVYKNEELKVKARLLVNGEVDRSGDYALRDVYWRIKEYDETPKYTSDSDGYSLYTLDTATKAGISVVREELGPYTDVEYDRKVDGEYYSQRRFKFDTVGTKFKIVAQSPFKYNNDGSDCVISNEIYVEYKKSGNSDDENPTPTPKPTPVTPTPVTPTPIAPTPVNPEKPTIDEPVKYENSSGKYVMPDPTKNEVVYIAPPADARKKTINIPDKISVDGKVMLVVKLGSGAFKKNKYVKTIKVGSNIKVIGKSAFEGATNLSKITLGKNVKLIEDKAFKNCTKLTQIAIPGKTTEIGNKAFEGDKKLKKVTIGKNVESIGDGVFKDCKLLTSISLPSKTTKIGAGAFKGCSKLKTIKIASKKLTSNTVAKGAFNGLTKKTTIKVPKSKLKKYIKLFKKKGINSKVIIKGY